MAAVTEKLRHDTQTNCTTSNPDSTPPPFVTQADQISTQILPRKELSPTSIPKKFSGTQLDSNQPLFIKLFAIFLVALVFFAPLAAAQNQKPLFSHQAKEPPASDAQLPVCPPNTVSSDQIVHQGSGNVVICPTESSCCRYLPAGTVEARDQTTCVYLPPSLIRSTSLKRDTLPKAVATITGEPYNQAILTDRRILDVLQGAWDIDSSKIWGALQRLSEQENQYESKILLSTLEMSIKTVNDRLQNKESLSKQKVWDGKYFINIFSSSVVAERTTLITNRDSYNDKDPLDHRIGTLLRHTSQNNLEEAKKALHELQTYVEAEQENPRLIEDAIKQCLEIAELKDKMIDTENAFSETPQNKRSGDIRYNDFSSFKSYFQNQLENTVDDSIVGILDDLKSEVST